MATPQFWCPTSRKTTPLSEGTYDEAEGMASRLEAIGLYEDKVESLKEQLSSLGGIADDVNTLITRWITLREQRQNQVKSLRSLSEELIALDVSEVEPLEAWKQGAYRILSLLLVLSTDLDVPYGLRVTSEMYEWVRSIRADLSRVPPSPHTSGMVETANRLYDKLILCAQGENGIIPSFKRQHVVSQQFAALTIRMDALSESIMIVAGQLMAQAERREDKLERIGEINEDARRFCGMVLCNVITQNRRRGAGAFPPERKRGGLWINHVRLLCRDLPCTCDFRR